MTEYYEARVLFDYDPVTSDELCLRVGESLEVRVGGGEEEEEGWLYGSDPRGHHGTFPANYVADLRPSSNCSGNYGGVSSAPSFHGPGDVELAGCGGASAAPIVDRAIVGPNDTEDVMSATSDRSKQDSNRAPYDPAQDTPESSDEQGRGYDGAATATPVAGDNKISESAPPTANTPQISTTNQRAAASGAELEGAASSSSQLPDGWLCAVDENSGVTYYYTADGQGSSWTRPVAAAPATGPLEGSGHRKESDGFTSASPSLTPVSACFNSIDV